MHCRIALILYSFKKIEEMRITIEDLESLKEINDELEEQQLHGDLRFLWRSLSYHIPQFISVQTEGVCQRHCQVRLSVPRLF